MPQIGLQACHIGAVACFTTRRAPSSPHLACGLNGAFFLRTFGPFTAAQAGALLCVLGRLKACGTLRRWVVFARLTGAHGWQDSVGASGKGLVFFELGVISWKSRICWA